MKIKNEAKTYCLTALYTANAPRTFAFAYKLSTLQNNGEGNKVFKYKFSDGVTINEDSSFTVTRPGIYFVQTYIWYKSETSKLNDLFESETDVGIIHSLKMNFLCFEPNFITTSSLCQLKINETVLPHTLFQNKSLGKSILQFVTIGFYVDDSRSIFAVQTSFTEGLSQYPTTDVLLSSKRNGWNIRKNAFIAPKNGTFVLLYSAQVSVNYMQTNYFKIIFFLNGEQIEEMSFSSTNFLQSGDEEKKNMCANLMRLYHFKAGDTITVKVKDVDTTESFESLFGGFHYSFDNGSPAEVNNLWSVTIKIEKLQDSADFMDLPRIFKPIWIDDNQLYDSANQSLTIRNTGIYYVAVMATLRHETGLSLHFCVRRNGNATILQLNRTDNIIHSTEVDSVATITSLDSNDALTIEPQESDVHDLGLHQHFELNFVGFLLIPRY